MRSIGRDAALAAGSPLACADVDDDVVTSLSVRNASSRAVAIALTRPRVHARAQVPGTRAAAHPVFCRGT
jgi:hypothetical protein